MSNKHVLYVLDVNGIIHYIKKALARLNQPFNVIQVIRYEPVLTHNKEITLRSDRIGAPIVERVMTYETHEVEELTELCLDITITDALASRILSLLLYDTSTRILAYQQWDNQIEEIAKEIFNTTEVNRNQITVAEYLLQCPEYDTIEHELGVALKMMVVEPWRDWKLIHNGNAFLAYGKRDFRITEWEQMTGNVKHDDTDVTIGVGSIIGYIATRIDPTVPQHVWNSAASLFMRALRTELSDVTVSLKPTRTSSFEYSENRIFFLHHVIPIVRSFVEGTLNTTLTKRLGCYTSAELVGNELVFSSQPDFQKFKEERDELLRDMENQDYVPTRLRKHYNL